MGCVLIRGLLEMKDKVKMDYDFEKDSDDEVIFTMTRKTFRLILTDVVLRVANFRNKMTIKEIEDFHIKNKKIICNSANKLKLEFEHIKDQIDKIEKPEN